MNKKVYITTPVYYGNAAPHIGHAYTQIVCDTIKRFEALYRGREVCLITGTDEHGEKIEKSTLAAGFKAGEEKQFVDTIVPKFEKLWDMLNVKYDIFIRTTDERHIEAVQHIFTQLFNKGDIYKKVYNGWFCTPCEMFWSESQAPKGICPDCQRACEKLDEENYFFRMSAYQKQLLTLIEEGRLVISPEMRRNEVLSFLKNNGLQDLCVSRPKERLRWGIELPFDKNFVAYVWVDALINYASGAGYPRDMKKFNELWPADMHVIGKDIIRHHAIYWPIILLALGMTPPKKVFAHGWWVVGGEKMSKSKGNFVDPVELLGERGFSVDAFRYFLLSQVAFGWDGVFSEDLLVEKYNSDLANDIGNLLNRTLTMVEKYFDGVIPRDNVAAGQAELGQEADAILSSIISSSGELKTKVAAAMDIDGHGPEFQQALKDMWDVMGKLNKFIEVSAPWKHSKAGNTAAIEVIISTLIQALGIITVLLYPFMPATAANMWEQLNSPGGKMIDQMKYPDIKWGMVPAGTKIKKGAPLFMRLPTAK